MAREGQRSSNGKNAKRHALFFFFNIIFLFYIYFEIQNYGYFELQLNGFFSGDFKIIFEQVFVAMELV